MRLVATVIKCFCLFSERLGGWEGLKALTNCCTVRVDLRLPLFREELSDSKRVHAHSVRAIVRARVELAALTLAAEYLRTLATNESLPAARADHRSGALSCLRACIHRCQWLMQQQFLFRQDQVEKLELLVSELPR